MAAGGELCSGNESDVTSGTTGTPHESRQRLRPWIIYQLNHNKIRGLEWVDEARTMFKIPWKHGGKQDWVPEQGQIFMEWARHTGKYREGIDAPQYAKWKTNLRCALNKAPDIRAIKDLSSKEDSNPFKVYEFLAKQKKQVTPVNIPEDYTNQSADPTACEVPTFVEQYVSSGSGSLAASGSSGGEAGRSLTRDNENLPSDLNSIKSGDLMQMSTGGNCTRPATTEHVISQEGMDFEEGDSVAEETSRVHQQPHHQQYQLQMINNNTDVTGQQYLPVNIVKSECSVFSSVSSPESIMLQQNVTTLSPQHQAPLVINVNQTDDVSPRHQTPLVISVHNMTSSTSQVGGEVFCYGDQRIGMNMTAGASNVPPPLPVITPSHHCIPLSRNEMNIDVLYRGQLVFTKHVTSTKGCRITHGVLPQEQESQIPDVLNTVLYGFDSKDREVIELPPWSYTLCDNDQRLSEGVSDLLQHMHRGMLLDCKNGDITAIRLCKTSVYYTSMFHETKKLIRHESGIEVTKIFDIENDFKPALERYKDKAGERPSPEVFMIIGQKGQKDDLRNLMVVIRITSCEATSLLAGVDGEKLYSMHISDSNEMDTVTDLMRDQLQEQPLEVAYNPIVTVAQDDISQDYNIDN